MTCWRRRIGSILWPARAEAHGNSAKANRGFVLALCVGLVLLTAGAIALAAAHWRDRRDFDGEDCEPPRKKFWRNLG